jgi:ubiquinone/menaquinone biosynthesis C-methylase UbiE
MLTRSAPAGRVPAGGRETERARIRWDAKNYCVGAGFRETASLNVRNAALLRWLIRSLYRTPLGPAPTAQSFELKDGCSDRVSGLVEFRDGKRFFRHFHGQLRERDLEGKHVLDIGCGFGGRTVYYAEVCKAASARGIEVNAATVDRCRRLAKELGSTRTSFSVGFAEELPFSDESFDAVVSFDVLEHCGDPRAAVREMARVLRPNGKAWNVFPTYKGARSSHLGYLTQIPAVQRIFHPDTVVAVVNEFLEQEGERLGTGIQPAPVRSSLGYYTLPSLNGLTLKDARRIFTSTERLTCEKIIITPLIDPQLSRSEMAAALGSSRLLGLTAFGVARLLSAWQQLLPLPELLIQNIAVSSVKTGS